MEEIIEIYTDASLMPNSQYFGIGIHIIDENECETSYGKFVDFNETKSKNIFINTKLTLNCNIL